MDQEKKDQKREIPVRPIVIGAAAVFCIMVIAAICAECGKEALPPDNIVNVIMPENQESAPPALPGDVIRNRLLEQRAGEALSVVSKGAIPPPPPINDGNWTQLPPAPPVPPCPIAGPAIRTCPKWQAGIGCAFGRFSPQAKADRLKIMIERDMNLLKYAGNRLPLRDVKRLADEIALLKTRLLETKPLPKGQKTPPFSIKKMMDEKNLEKAMSRQVFQTAEIISRLGRIEGQLAALEKLAGLMRRMENDRLAQKRQDAALEKNGSAERMVRLKNIIEKARERAREQQDEIGRHTYRDFLNEIYRQPQLDSD